MLIPVSVATLNDNFNSPGTNVPRVAPRADITLGQEGKARHYRDDLPQADYGVFQDSSTQARAGSFIVWQRGQQLGPARRSLVFASDGGDLLTRYLACMQFNLWRPGHREAVAESLFIAGHRPPERDDILWAEWDGNLIERVNRRENRRHAIVGADWNEAHPDHVLKATGLVWHSVGPRRIDGFAACPCIDFTQVKVLPKWTSDHQPVTAVAHIPTGSCKR